jgi:UDP-N-acetylglucosamine 1-carboxyvinyltransferase
MSLSISKRSLKGIVKISGAKNSSLRLLAASILTTESVRLSNYPTGLLDIQIHEKMLVQLGKKIEHLDSSSVKIYQDSAKLQTSLIWEERSIRNTLLILGALLARYGEGKVPLPGGCKLGDRKYDLHVMAMEKLGAIVWEEDNYLCAKARANNRLLGTEVHLPIRSTGATENLILMGSLADGITTIYNPHIRPEIMDLIAMLSAMGANIKVYGQRSIEIKGVELLRGVDHNVIPDNMEALTWAIGSVITNGDVEIQNFPFEHLEVPLIYLRESGMRFFRGKDALIVKGGIPFPIEISTGPYPGINSDMQPLFAVYGTLSKGESRIIDLRFPGRYAYAEELAKLGMRYRIDGHMLVIEGGTTFKGGEVKALDLRAGIALLLAGMTSDEEVIIEDDWQIYRGYENLKEKLSNLNY